MPPSLRILASAFCLLTFPVPAHAFRLIPIEMELAPSGRGATQIFRVENDNKDPVAIEVRVAARAMSVDGQDVLADDTENFVIFPEQIVLQPGENQSIRVQWAGDPNPDRELAFRLIADQLDVDIGRPTRPGGQVRLLIKYVASLYVVPPGAAPAVSVVGAEARNVEGTKALELVLRNDGTARKVMREPTLELRQGGRSISLTGPQLAGLVGENLLAGTTRRFLVPWPEGLGDGPVTASLSVP